MNINRINSDSSIYISRIASGESDMGIFSPVVSFCSGLIISELQGCSFCSKTVCSVKLQNSSFHTDPRGSP